MIPSSCIVHINWENFRHNLRILMRKGKSLMPVIKADAYGHGVLPASEVLSELGIDWAAIGTLEEGRQVRDHGYAGNIVSLLSFTLSEEDVALALEKGITPLVHNWEGLKAVESIMRSRQDDSMLSIAIKTDTGMGRLGFQPDEIEETAAFIAASGRLRPVLLLSHLAVADEPENDAYTIRQAELFARASETMRRFFPGLPCSLGNTAGLVSHTERCGDICRPGLAIYGYNPQFGTSREKDCEGLLPVMSVSVPLICVRPLRKGESLGYGLSYTAESDRLIGWAAIGYADGYRRNPSPEACMCVNGIRVPVIGRVAMQTTCLDLTDLPFTPAPGDPVHILGGPGHAVSAQELADWWGTIPYEVTCLLGKNTRN
ncbi:MAG: alanine racemase [Mailhella sp.]|nr:alanine racemase [Mailhella sp.]